MSFIGAAQSTAYTMRTRSLAADDRFLAAVCLAASLCLPLAEGVAETIRFDSVSDW